MDKYLQRTKNNVWIGLAIGLLIPGVLLVAAWYIIHHQNLKKVDLLYIACIAVNAYTMQVYFRLNKEQVGRGILSATFLWAFVFFFYKVA
ncbi:MAG: stationary phase survival protein SurE [Pedobacter sp.]|nr:MAG: stationary phase survival protein SurE [Pedobacter sp.]